jgi:acetyl esterase/lipase
VPYCTYPAPADDVQKVREWIHANIESEDYGSGSSSQVVLVGQSAGGSHVATNLYSRGDKARPVKEAQDPPLAGIAYLSAPFYFNHTIARRAQTLREYYGSSEPEHWKDRSPIGLLEHLPEADAALNAKKLPTMMLVGEYDP